MAVPHVTRAEFASAAADDGQPGIANQRTQLAIEDLVPDTEFAAASRVIANIEAAPGALIAEDGNPRQARE